MATVYNVLDTRDKQELTERIDSDKNELSKTIQNTKTELQSNIDALESQHDEDKTELQTQIDSLESTKADKTEITAHNASTSAHNDIRLLIQNLTTKLNTIADSDDSTLDQMSEIVEYIKNNKELIDSITTTKVSVSDIINNLVTNVANKPLSAAMGVELKALIDTIPDTTLATVNEKILEHNVSADAHEDIRNDIASLQSDVVTAQAAAETAQTSADNAQDDADEALQRLNSLEVGSGKIDRIVETTNGIAVCEDPLIGAPLVGATVYGVTRQNLWSNPTGTSDGITVTSNAGGSVTISGTMNGVTVTANENGSVTLSGTSTGVANPYTQVYVLRPGSAYTVSVDKVVQSSNEPSNGCFFLEMHDSDSMLLTRYVGYGTATAVTFTVPDGTAFARIGFYCAKGRTVSGTYRIMLNEGSEPEPWCPPGLNGVDELSVVTAGKNLYKPFTSGKVTANDDGSMTVEASAATWANGTINSINLPAGTQVTLSTDNVYGAKVGFGAFFFASDNSRTEANLYNLSSRTIQLSEDCVAYQCWFSGTTDSAVTSHVMMEVGSTATSFEPYQGIATPIDLDGNILCSLPDGTCDELTIDGTGAVTLTKRTWSQTIDGADLAQDYEGNAAGCTIWDYALEYDSIGPNGSSKWLDDGVALGDVLLPDNSTFSKTVLGFSGTSYSVSTRKNLYVNAPCNSLTDYVGARAWLNANPLTIVYKLAEPQIIYLGTIDSPTLPAQTSHVWFTSNIPVNDFSVRYWLPNGELVEELYRTGATEEISDNEIISIWNGATGDIIEATNADIEAIFE